MSPRARDFLPDGERAANGTVAVLRTAAGRDSHDRVLSDLVGELFTRSEDLRARWAAHSVHQHRTGTRTMHHPVVGGLELGFEAMELTADPGLPLLACSAEPGSPSAEGPDLLSSWAATLEREWGGARRPTAIGPPRPRADTWRDRSAPDRRSPPDVPTPSGVG
ncbi:MmyB family transcriptional regulator [Nocardiopsis deserti]|uniref:MmyB family transcriptional regulator n=1 Tax=Nocardiopsis deserti TaxID=2605988 RepID=UPI001CC22943|nr:hypothetical protein [Nocardiopsis deserti]